MKFVENKISKLVTDNHFSHVNTFILTTWKIRLHLHCEKSLPSGCMCTGIIKL